MPVLVTGGCGFIGSHLVDALLAAGAQVRVLGKYSSRSDRGLLADNHHPNLEVHLGDVADPWFVRNLMEGVDTVFHLAALIGIPYSYQAPEQYVQTNIRGTLSVLEAALGAKVRRVVHTSTSEAYGTAQYQPIDERHPLVGQSPYSATKIAADKLAESYFLSFDVPVATIRPFNTFGPRQSMRAVIPSMMAQALWSDEIVVGSLDPVRDMNYVLDTVEGFMAIAQPEEALGKTFNIGSGQGRTIGEILKLVQDVAGTDKPIRVAEERVRPAGSEVEVLVCDYSLAKATFGYEPRHDFRQALEEVRGYLEPVGRTGDASGYRV
jgi:NAD dependent epimerase/dehydratase